MLRSGFSPNAFTFPFILKSYAALSLPISGSQLHCHVIKTGCDPDPFVQTSLILMYCRCSSIEYARKVFDKNGESRKLTICYNALISGYTSNSRFYDGVLLFCKMRTAGVSGDSVTMLGLEPFCMLPVHLSLGMCLHGCCVKVGLDSGACGLESARGNFCVVGEVLGLGGVGGDLDTDEVVVDYEAGGDPRIEGREEGRYATCGDDCEEATRIELVA
ncbi:hypothetical protein CMV_024576 [Castanea mollissima]|uniref:Pentatricopeptide repeat-containing protein n=1 Tax=Castanea mollissima TaxID=60419 RepID=A0A8J4QR99_9ROSI|nr:hypothetical protein CMV_024576 [Castanea mollissima]